MAGDIEKGVERAAGAWATDAGHGGEPATHKIAAGLELAPHLGNTLLRAFQRRQRRVLAHAARAAGLLTLHVTHRLDDRRRTERPAHAPAGHSLGLRGP